MNDRKAVVAIMFIFLPVCYALLRLMNKFSVIDFVYLLVISSLLIQYGIRNIKRKCN